jgi:diketogulonate reductase-like aldo/keto reductase
MEGALLIMKKESVSIKKAINDLLETSIFKEIAKRNSNDFAQKLAVWLVRYILVVTSMNESLKTGLEGALFNLHGDKLKKILEVTEKTFHNVKGYTEETNNYIW